MTLRTLRITLVTAATTTLVTGFVLALRAGSDGSGPTLAADWRSYLSSFYQVVATFSALGLATGFIAAQLAPGPGRQRIYALTRQPTLIVFALVSCLSTASAYLLVAIGDPWQSTAAVQVIALLLFFLGAWVVLTVLPIWMLQIELLHPEGVARRVVKQLTIARAREYGLTRVERTSEGRCTVALSLYGTRPRGVDPLRPIHEVIMDAVAQRDRVLLGRLSQILLDRVASAHGVVLTQPQVPLTRAENVHWRWRRLWIGRSDDEGRLHLTLLVCHYMVKRSRLLVAEWERRDTPRHSLLTGLIDLAGGLCLDKRNEQSLGIVLWAIAHITDAYRDVTPYGPSEPLVGLLYMPRTCAEKGMLELSDTTLGLLMWAKEHTSQLDADRLDFEASAQLSRLETRQYSGVTTLAMEGTADDPWFDPRNLNFVAALHADEGGGAQHAIPNRPKRLSDRILAHLCKDGSTLVVLWARTRFARRHISPWRNCARANPTVGVWFVSPCEMLASVPGRYGPIDLFRTRRLLGSPVNRRLS